MITKDKICSECKLSARLYRVEVTDKGTRKFYFCANPNCGEYMNIYEPEEVNPEEGQ